MRIGHGIVDILEPADGAAAFELVRRNTPGVQGQDLSEVIFMLTTSKACVIVVCAFIALLMPCLEAKAQRDTIGKISGEVSVSFLTEELSAKMTYDYVATQESEQTTTFYLNDAFKVRQVRCRVCGSFNFDTQAKPRPSLVISFKKPLARGKRLPITIEYAGSLNKVLYKPEQKYLELGLDSFWFPVHKNSDQFKFLYRLAVKTDEPNRQLFSNGRSVKTRGGWVVISKVPDFDIDLILAEGLKVKAYTQGIYNLQIVSQMPEEASMTLLTTMKDALDFYNFTFGSFDTQKEVTGVFRPFLGASVRLLSKRVFRAPAGRRRQEDRLPGYARARTLLVAKCWARARLAQREFCRIQRDAVPAQTTRSGSISQNARR